MFAKINTYLEKELQPPQTDWTFSMYNRYNSLNFSKTLNIHFSTSVRCINNEYMFWKSTSNSTTWLYLECTMINISKINFLLRYRCKNPISEKFKNSYLDFCTTYRKKWVDILEEYSKLHSLTVFSMYNLENFRRSVFISQLIQFFKCLTIHTSFCWRRMNEKSTYSDKVLQSPQYNCIFYVQLLKFVKSINVADLLLQKFDLKTFILRLMYDVLKNVYTV